ncbi:MAG: alginate O-acetyltransferase AlgF [Pseudomonas sp.]|uniref:alginate O-acetyltransferase AlgF n=1 Tax=Pseudomonas abieticivorans TaxID=2931382 RepID=UPI0020BF2BE4|nr:alginate O-acetyltransferase AlgF [Pseudomonas sp. PIA16]MDE1167863.1 alginate O-acetyltransferase AlgF [Pseudomonas sp.]
MSRLLIALLAVATASTQAADIALYPTGPSQDSAFLRFINPQASPLDLIAGGPDNRLRLDSTQPVSNYLTVPANQAIKGTLLRDGKRQMLSIQVAPGEFATVIALGTTRQGIEPMVVREQPDDFNALKASVAFVNADKGCARAGLRPAGLNVELFSALATGELQRRAINPLHLAVQGRCGDVDAGPPLDLGLLKAGERYTVLLLPGANGPVLLRTLDTLAH